MSPLQKSIIRKLFAGYSISGMKAYGYRLRDEQANVRYKFSEATFLRIHKVLRRAGDLYVLDRRQVRQLHGNSFIKRLYKELRRNPDTELLKDSHLKMKSKSLRILDAETVNPQLSLFN